jgi:hypothetical protein
MLLFIKPFSETNDDRLEKVSWMEYYGKCFNTTVCRLIKKTNDSNLFLV